MFPELNTQSKNSEATINKSVEQPETLDVGIPELEQKQENATAMRKEKHTQDQTAVME